MKTREQKRTEAQQRAEAYSKLTTAQRYKRALERGHTLSREARRYALQLHEEGLGDVQNDILCAYLLPEDGAE